LRQAYDYWQNQPGNYLERRSSTVTTPRASGAERYPDGGPQPPTGRVPGAMLRQGLPAIRLPPLSFPKGRPPHQGRALERSRRVSSGPLRGRIPSAGPRPGWDGSLLGLASNCLGRVVPSRQTSTDPNRARRAGAGESSGTSGPAVDRRACLGDGPLPVLPYVGSSRPRRVATGQ
jgi:hypothetical protein